MSTFFCIRVSTSHQAIWLQLSPSTGIAIPQSLPSRDNDHVLLSHGTISNTCEDLRRILSTTLYIGHKKWICSVPLLTGSTLCHSRVALTFMQSYPSRHFTLCLFIFLISFFFFKIFFLFFFTLTFASHESKNHLMQRFYVSVNHFFYSRDP